MQKTTAPRCVGITVAVGSPYIEIASLAAACFSQHTGMPALVLGDKEFAASGLPHPAALRLLAFDHVSVDRLVYFDADWLCLQPWSPFDGIASDIRACRDFILQDEFPRQHYEFDSPDFLDEPRDLCHTPGATLRYDYLGEVERFASIRLPYSAWINSGLLVLSRNHHAIWFKTALDLYLGAVGHHDTYFEQPALVKALEQLDLRVNLLPRRFNVLSAFETRWPASVIGLHIKLKRHRAFLESVQAGTICTPEDVRSYFAATSR